ncbi:MAG TPA: enoyl-CoA hydratase/isomerase family protein [Solirubrobacteraceae bacterium]|nr:enoyl-CoA hydratase/isomerase family protein [Solirubrobacteraceae bacterium]
MSYAKHQLHGDAVAIVTMDREDRLNALSVELVEDVLAELHAVEQMEKVRSVVLTGAGRAFCSGGDLGDIGSRVAGGEPQTRLAVMRSLHRLIVALRDSRLPVVAAIHGPTYGAGVSVALACDLLVASRDASFCEVFVRRNLVPDLGSAWLLPRAIGTQAAKELMFLGDAISAEQAERLGLVNRVVETPADALAEALSMAESMTATLPATMAMTKGLVNRSQGLTLEDALRLEEHAQAIALGTEQTLAAMRAFLEQGDK